MVNSLVNDDLEVCLRSAEALCEEAAPENEPYKNLYKARETLEGFVEKSKTEVQVARIDAKLGYIANQVEEPQVAEVKLSSALRVLAPGAESLSNEEESAERLTLVLAALNEVLAERSISETADTASALTQAALLWDARDQSKRALALLNIALTVCQKTKSAELQSTETHACFYLAQVYGRLRDFERSAFFCRRTLERQLPLSNETRGEWATNALGLGAFYAGAGKPLAAIACAKAALAADSHDDTLRADAYLLYARVHLNWLLQEEKTPLLSDDGVAEALKTDTKIDFFPKAELDNDAKKTFVAAKRAFEVASEHYVLDGFVTEHVGIARDRARLYSLRLREEKDSKRRLALQLKRLDILEPLRAALNPTIYADLRAALAFEAGDAALGALDEKETRTKTSQARRNNCAKLRDQGLAAYDDVRACAMMNNNNNKDSSILAVDVDHVLPCLRSRFYAARLAGLEFVDTDDPIALATDSLDRFTAVANDARAVLSERTKSLAPLDLPEDFFQAELKICQDMISLLPTKIDNLKHPSRPYQLPSDDDDTSTVALPPPTTT